MLRVCRSDTGPDHAAAAQRGLRTSVTYSKMPSGMQLGRIAVLLTIGQVRPPRIETLPLEHVAKAHDLLESGNAKVMLVLQIAG
ncbi:zinc-binding dehydrogenase [Pseudomonas sp. BN417]|uniref:zinc-binding dehydrogenase n=1 Tax=Pseudomonas sp. BN417 TaxID=2567890 RepID=UPI0024568E97|nr:zinc-binding dehydrogenase [Pseudomonas sp. BN417]